jgi:hypothetical protein
MGEVDGGHSQVEEESQRPCAGPLVARRATTEEQTWQRVARRAGVAARGRAVEEEAAGTACGSGSDNAGDVQRSVVE